MKEQQSLLPRSHEHQNLKAEIERLTVQLESIEGKTQEFEALPVSKISDLPVEEQELTAMYRQKAKKAMLAAQKNKGKQGTMPATNESVVLRLRPIIMTSLAFILGVMPLVFTSCAGVVCSD